MYSSFTYASIRRKRVWESEKHYVHRETQPESFSKRKHNHLKKSVSTQNYWKRCNMYASARQRARTDKNVQ